MPCELETAMNAFQSLRLKSTVATYADKLERQKHTSSGPKRAIEQSVDDMIDERAVYGVFTLGKNVEIENLLSRTDRKVIAIGFDVEDLQPVVAALMATQGEVARADEVITAIDKQFKKISSFYIDTLYRGTVFERWTRTDADSLFNRDGVLFFSSTEEVAESYAWGAGDDQYFGRIRGDLTLGPIDRQTNQVVGIFSPRILEQIGHFRVDDLDCTIEEFGGEFREVEGIWALHVSRDTWRMIPSPKEQLSASWSLISCQEVEFHVTNPNVDIFYEALRSVYLPEGRVGNSVDVLELSAFTTSEEKRRAIRRWGDTLVAIS